MEAIYEPPPASRIVKKQSLTTPSESDEPQYSGQSLYGQRAPSQCSSISATQSFDLRMYGRLPKGVPIPSGVATGTLKKTEETRFVIFDLKNKYLFTRLESWLLNKGVSPQNILRGFSVGVAHLKILC